MHNEKNLSNFINFTLIFTPIQMRVWFVEEFHLYLLPLSLKITNFLFELHGGILLLILLVDGGALLLLVPEIEIVVQIVVVFLLAIVRTLVGALGDLVQVGIDERAEVDCIRCQVPSI